MVCVAESDRQGNGFVGVHSLLFRVKKKGGQKAAPGYALYQSRLEHVFGAQVENAGIIVRVVKSTSEVVGADNVGIVGVCSISILEVLIHVAKIEAPAFVGFKGEFRIN
jgi:hypothetical protein